MRSATLTLFQGLILTIIFLGFFSFLYAYNKPAYYGQYNYRYNYGYNNYAYNNYGYNYRPYSQGPYPMPSTCSSYYGCGNNYNSYIYVHNALDYMYYSQPWLLEPRYSNNNMRYARGLWPQMFYY
jgi:hypothetical protein